MTLHTKHTKRRLNDSTTFGVAGQERGVWVPEQLDDRARERQRPRAVAAVDRVVERPLVPGREWWGHPTISMPRVYSIFDRAAGGTRTAAPGVASRAGSRRARCAALARATVSFYTVIVCHWLSFLRDLHSNLAFIAVSFCRNDSVAPG